MVACAVHVNCEVTLLFSGCAVRAVARARAAAPKRPLSAYPRSRAGRRRAERSCRRRGSRKRLPSRWASILPPDGSSPRVWGTGAGKPASLDLSRFIPTRVGNRRTSTRCCAIRSVHPHACGEQVHFGLSGRADVGSSPRVWGTGNSRPRERSPGRFIPTRVGNSSCPNRATTRWPVHPHACGEQAAVEAIADADNGSSPRVWGTGALTTGGAAAARFIPTRVGNSAAACDRRPGIPVHPHACGEQNWRRDHRCPEPGSSPRVWGTGPLRPETSCIGRFIPTRVGNSSRSRTGRTRPPVHPHACGEQVDHAVVSVRGSGSSPRVWGTAVVHGERAAPDRFIPTRVGNSARRRTTAARRAVHPHACGEQEHDRALGRCRAGSSPRVWGTVRPHRARPRRRRFIPTRVGNRATCPRSVPRRPVHPHACGEQPAWDVGVRDRDGSSPRVWGTGLLRVPERRTCRFIPTRVGNRSSPSIRPMRSSVHPQACGEQGYGGGGGGGAYGSSPRVWGTASECRVIPAPTRFIPTRVGNRARSAPRRSRRPVHPHACGEQN